MDKIKALLDELAAVVAEMETMTEGEGEDSAPMTEEQEASLRSLEQRAEKLRERIEFLQRVQAKNIELRAVLERAAPAKAIETPETKEPEVENRHYAVPKDHGTLKAFSGPDASERAYRAGMHIKGYVFGDAEARRWCKDHGVESRVQAGGVNSLGGVLTSPELSSEIIRLVEEFGVFPQYAKRVNMNSDTLVYARRTGGLTARPVGENVEVTASDVTFDNVELTAKIWGVANRTSNSLLEDSVIDLADAMAVETAQAFSEAFDNAGFIGDGTLTYHGVTGVAVKVLQAAYSASVVTATSNTTFGDLTMKNFTDLLARLPLYARNRNARWYISPAGWGAAMLRLAMLPGGASGAGGNSSDNVASGFGETFLGYPVTLVQPMQSALTGTTGTVAALFGDLSQAAIFGERRAISIKTASERYIEFDQTLTFATTRNAMIVNDLGSTIKAGPVVALKFG
ncbi:MAG: phage major capsid protein [Planctomycetes bacterium]|nr:phage major capsid protein [Planctomycetota bacterium]